MDPGHSSGSQHPQYTHPSQQQHQYSMQHPQHQQSMRPMNMQPHQQMPRPELPSEPSVQTIRQQVQRPLSGPQQQLLASTVQAPPGANIQEFIQRLEEFSPTIPDSVTTYYMEKSGLNSNDPRVVRLISLATQKFITDIVLDSMMQAKMTSTGQSGGGKKSKEAPKFTLTPELLEPVLREHGLDISKPPYQH